MKNEWGNRSFFEARPESQNHAGNRKMGNDTVDGSDILHHPGVYKKSVNNGIH